MLHTIDISNTKCWNETTIIHKQQILKIINKMRPLFNNYINYANMGLSGYRLFGGIIMYEKEIQEIAQILEISFTECLMFQLTYELFSACTTGILKSDNEYVCVRVMDWELELLKEITIQIKVVNRGVHLFDSITWAGFVGIFTGIKPNNYTIALNYKRSEQPDFLKNIISLFKGYYPNAFLIRDILTNDNVSVAYDRLKQSSLIAPAYYTFMSEPFKCTIIRDRETAKVKVAPCIQTNCDDINGLNIMFSHERLSYMNNILYSNLSLKDLITHISHYPVNNQHTIYTVIMTLKNFIYFKV